MNAGSCSNEELISAVGWYFETKNYHLEKAVTFRSPLSTNELKEMRIAYANYFVSLMAAIDVLRERDYKYRQSFIEKLYSNFSFEGNDGKTCFGYLRELRNSIVHRGLDIASAATFVDNFPLLIAPKEINDSKEKNCYKAFCVNVIDIIEKVESVIGEIFISHFEINGLFESSFSIDELKEKAKNEIEKSFHVPQWVKKQALQEIKKLDFAELKKQKNIELREVLRYKPLSGLV